MNLSIKATNTTITDAIRNQIEAKLEPLQNFLKPEDKVHVELQEDNHHQHGRFSRVEVHITPRGLYAEANGEDFYEALDLAVPKIKSQLAKSKDKFTSLRRKLGNLFKRS